MDLQEFKEVVEETKKKLFPGEKMIVREPVLNELGEVVYDGKISIIKEVFPEIPYRTPRDLKGYDDTVINEDPSLLDLTNYVDNRDMIARLMASFPSSVLTQIAESHDKDDPDFSDLDVDDYDEYDETAEPLDNITEIANRKMAELSELSSELTKKQAKTKAKQVEEERSDDDTQLADVKQALDD